MQNSTVGLGVAKICSYFNSRPRGDAARHKDRERSVPEPVPPADRTKLQPWLQRASARPDGLLALSDARSAGEAQIQQAVVGSAALKLLFPPPVSKGSSFTPSSGLYATNNSVSNPANYTAAQQVTVAWLLTHTLHTRVALNQTYGHGESRRSGGELFILMSPYDGRDFTGRSRA